MKQFKIFICLSMCILYLSCEQPSINDETDKVLLGQKVAISAGHGLSYNSDTNTWNYQRSELNGILEDIYTQEFCMNYLAPKLKEEGAEVIFLRNEDNNYYGLSGYEAWKEDAITYISSKGYEEFPGDYNDVTIRPAYAKKMEADIFISIHLDKINEITRGTHIAVFGEMNFPTNIRSDYNYQSSSLLLATKMQENLFNSAIAYDPTWNNLGLFEGNLGELREFYNDWYSGLGDIPSVMVFLGCIDNVDDIKMLIEDDFKRALAEAIVLSLK